ncbi:outer membrane protein assembly factor BamE [Pusillimonas sp. CC-YST705]|uniref:Outer membrane protein assembly factor BamE n=1 Tax=Mesopusillimonas faecipullorum TaxID=2755040 RepID=A0ABS8C8H3_9BURK|nr:outer membrane protein assembly factor BamE [Mesopusillimonas faecipullorum]
MISVTLAVTLSACGSTKWGFPYRADVQQGNWITAEQVAELQTGMSRAQVRYVLGTPVLQDALHSNRWDYTYYNKPGYGDAELRRFTVWFDGDLVTRWDGDPQPDRQPYERTDTGALEQAEAIEAGLKPLEDVPDAAVTAAEEAATPSAINPLP